MAEKTAREAALDSLMRILEQGEFSSAVLGEANAYPQLSGRDRAFYIRLIQGTGEHLLRIDYHLDTVSDVPVRRMKPLIRTLLRMSAYQILFLDRVPDHAAVSEAVSIAGRRGFGRLKGFVNGVLRSLARQKETLPLPDPHAQLQQYLSVVYSCPQWITQRWTDAYGPACTEKMLQTFSGEKELCLWANPRRITAQELSQSLRQQGISVRPHPETEGVLLCSGMDGIARNPAFREGLFYIQNHSSILAARAGLEAMRKIPESPDPVHVIDVCGAPGGKSLYLAAHAQGPVRIFCRDVSEGKTQRIAENAARLGLSDILTPQLQDACEPREEDIASADLVIADLPCSGLGLISRKADMRYRLKETDIAQLVSLQRSILTTVSRYLKPGGFLLYSTCTVTPEENEEQAAWIREILHLDPVPFRDAPEGCLQLLPQREPYQDGFFIALFRKLCCSP